MLGVGCPTVATNKGFDALYIEIQKQDARGLKKILKSVELEKSNRDTDQDNE